MAIYLSFYGINTQVETKKSEHKVTNVFNDFLIDVVLQWRDLHVMFE